MKRILVLLLALTLVFSLASCDEEELTPMERFNSIYKLSQPTMVVSQVVQTHGIYTLNADYTYIKGQVDGKNATQYVAVYDKLETIEGGISDVVTGPVVTVTESKEYVEGKGVRENGGAWVKGEDFAPDAGALILNITEELLPDYSYADNVFAATVDKDNTEAVLGIEIPVDVELEITTNGTVITSVSISYEIEEDDSEDYPAITVSITSVYSYDVQAITLVKGK